MPDSKNYKNSIRSVNHRLTSNQLADGRPTDARNAPRRADAHTRAAPLASWPPRHLASRARSPPRPLADCVRAPPRPLASLASRPHTRRLGSRPVRHVDRWEPSRSRGGGARGGRGRRGGARALGRVGAGRRGGAWQAGRGVAGAWRGAFRLSRGANRPTKWPVG
ncbi:hypothetical protein GUJ93_ZPchr0002g23202 [Zizania palustris]|uniref:Uncharacterized protein n=1 Tax=Zizania palustris TaxID=103762 RepID=A0A8J5VWF9_ZIZPA|nr:hypothetical protein GUJ93_ZPchr0002g23202 [Zizania palustris]